MNLTRRWYAGLEGSHTLHVAKQQGQGNAMVLATGKGYS